MKPVVGSSWFVIGIIANTDMQVLAMPMGMVHDAGISKSGAANCQDRGLVHIGDDEVKTLRS